MSDDVVLKLNIDDAEKIYSMLRIGDMCIFSTPFKLFMKQLRNEIKKHHGDYTLEPDMLGNTKVFRIFKGCVDTGALSDTESSAYDIINAWNRYEIEQKSRKEVDDKNDTQCPCCEQKFKNWSTSKCFTCDSIFSSKKDMKPYGQIVLCKICYEKTANGKK